MEEEIKNSLEEINKEVEAEKGVDITKEEKSFDWLGLLVGFLFIAVLGLTVSNCSLRDRVADLKETAQEVSIDDVTDGNWYANCYRWNMDGGIDFACYEEDVWDAPCMMSFRMLEKAPDIHGDISTFMLEVREVCPSQ